jgi:serine-threonine kinase receptor-associated protein
VAFVPGPKPALVATGGSDKKLRIFDLENVSGTGNGSMEPGTDSNGERPVPSYEIGAGIHNGSIQAVVWGTDRNVVITGAEDKTIRWWDLRTAEKPIQTYEIEGTLGSCEFNKLAGGDPQDAYLAVAGGKKAYFFSATTPGQLMREHELPYEVASVAVNAKEKKFVIGGRSEQWVRVYDLDTCEELNVLKGHHGPVWSTSFSPDGKLCATGSEDGTIKLWKVTSESYGLWR